MIFIPSSVSLNETWKKEVRGKIRKLRCLVLTTVILRRRHIQIVSFQWNEGGTNDSSARPVHGALAIVPLDF